MGIGFNIIKRTISKLPSAAVKKPMANAEPFCHKYWKELQGLRPLNRDSVSLHGQLNGINHHFINSPYPKHMDMQFMNSGFTPREMISKTDIEFKLIKPTEQNLKVYRCIGEKPDFFSEYNLYKKRLNIKKGDVIDMKEYAYATSDEGYAGAYLTNNRGIKYEIDVPKGSKVSRTGDASSTDEIVFPRSSKFECTGVGKVKDENNDYLLVKLKYLKPDESYLA